jgi:hypothetical protein
MEKKSTFFSVGVFGVDQAETALPIGVGRVEKGSVEKGSGKGVSS